MSDTGWTFKDIAEALLIDEETISRHIKKNILKAKNFQVSTGGSEGKLSSEQLPKYKVLGGNYVS